jgi:hypothetical protein
LASVSSDFVVRVLLAGWSRYEELCHGYRGAAPIGASGGDLVDPVWGLLDMSAEGRGDL